MLKPIRIRIPTGSMLEKRVDYIESLDVPSDGDWREPGVLGELAIRRRLAAEPRLWKHDAKFVREVIIPRKIASEDGQHVLDFLERYAPQRIAHIASREIDHAFRTAKASERLAPITTPGASAVMVVMVEYLRCRRARPKGTAETALYIAVQKSLGVDRNVVRRVIRQIASRLARQNEHESDEFYAAFAYIASLIDQHDRGPKHRVRNTLARCA